MLTRHRRRSEQGQALIAIFLVFLAVVTTVGFASFRFAQVTSLQHRETGATASTHGGTEGSALYSQVDLSRPDALPCSDGGTGSLTFQPGAGNATKLAYSYPAGGQCSTAGAGGAGQQCALCVLSQQATDFQINRPVAIEGEIAINGDVDLKHNGQLCADSVGGTACDGKGTIYVGGTCCGSGTLDPAPQSLNPPIGDPLGGIFPPPEITAAGSTIGGVAQSGVWSTLSTTLLADRGTFVVTSHLVGPLAVAPVYTSSATTTYTPTTATDPAANWAINSWAGHWLRQGALGSANTARIVSNTATVLTLASSPAQGAWSSDTPPNTHTVFTIDGTAFIYLAGADVQIANNSDIVLAGPPSGPYAGGSIVASAADTQAITFNGQSSMFLAGSLDAPGMAVSVTGGGNSGLGIDMAAGRVVVSSISATVSNNTSGLVVNGNVPGQSGCNVYEPTLNWSVGAATKGTGRAVIQSSCGGGTGILSFDYSP